MAGIYEWAQFDVAPWSAEFKLQLSSYGWFKGPISKKKILLSLTPNSWKTDVLGWWPTPATIPKHQFLMSWEWDSVINFPHQKDL